MIGWDFMRPIGLSSVPSHLDFFLHAQWLVLAVFMTPDFWEPGNVVRLNFESKLFNF